ncbi:hypothetical protein RND81_08G084100 [Saponaria officinalis]|uniref:Disease resistance protein winged helix domain-containing protein n=1 Tax=Saponaria officinalis TaxID=3572 RepID=A0AAW1J7I1_SAPOF
MGHFPEDYPIDVQKLYHLWIADVVVSSTQNQIGKKRSIEDIADNYLNQLVQKGMIQVIGKDADGRIDTCSLHDLMRDKCIEMTRDENFLQIVNINELQKASTDARTDRSRRVTMYVGKEDSHSVLKSLSGKLSCLRSLMFISTCTEQDRSEDSCEWIRTICEKFMLLRALDFEGGGTHITELPSAIRNLKSLLILDLRVSGVVIKLPNVLSEMISLCYLYFPGRHLSQEGYSTQGYKTEDGTLLILDKLNHLERVDDVDLDEVDGKGLLELAKSSSLRILHVDANRYPSTYLPIQVDMFPCNLVELGFWYCKFQEDPMPVLEKLPKLRNLQLRICYKGKKISCSKNAFPELTFLVLDGLFSLQVWDVEDGGFPKFQKMEIYNCPLKKIPAVLPPKIIIGCSNNLRQVVDDFRQQGKASTHTQDI